MFFFSERFHFNKFVVRVIELEISRLQQESICRFTHLTPPPTGRYDICCSTVSAGEVNRSSSAHVDDSIDRIDSYALETDANLCRGNQGHLIQFNNFLFPAVFHNRKGLWAMVRDCLLSPLFWSGTQKSSLSDTQRVFFLFFSLFYFFLDFFILCKASPAVS